MTDTSTTKRTEPVSDEAKKIQRAQAHKQEGGSQKGSQSKKAAKSQPKKATQKQEKNDVSDPNPTPEVGEPEFVADNPPSGGGGTSQWDKVIDRLVNSDDTKPGTWYRLWTIGTDDADDPAKDARRRANGIRGRVRKRDDVNGIEVAVRPTGDGRHGVWVRLSKQTGEGEAASAS